MSCGTLLFQTSDEPDENESLPVGFFVIFLAIASLALLKLFCVHLGLVTPKTMRSCNLLIQPLCVNLIKQ
jgi:hypothetical protein